MVFCTRYIYDNKSSDKIVWIMECNTGYIFVFFVCNFVAVICMNNLSYIVSVKLVS